MADDSSYLSFLEKANEPTTTTSNTSNTSASTQAQQSKTQESSLISTSSAAPSSLAESAHVFRSETDEPFQPVSLTLPAGLVQDGQKLSVDAFKRVALASRNAGYVEVEGVALAEFERMGYGEVVQTVRDALGSGQGSGEKDGDELISVFQVQRDHARIEWWVVGVKEGVLLGLMAKAVET